MRLNRALRVLLAAIITAGSAIAQSGYTIVTANMSQCYGNGSIQASWINQSSSSNLPLLNGSTFSQQVPSNIDSAGNWTIKLADVNQLNVSPSQWKITACAKGGSQPSCYSQTLTITGSTMDVSSDFVLAPVPSGCTIGVASVTGSTANGLVVTATPRIGNIVVSAGPDTTHVIPVNTGSPADYLGEDGGYHDYTSLIPSTAIKYQTAYLNGSAFPQELGYNFSQRFVLADDPGANATNVDAQSVGTAGTYPAPISITTDLWGRVTHVTSGGSTTPVPRTCNANGCYQIDADGTIRQWGPAGGCGGGDGCTIPLTFPTPFTTTANLIVNCTAIYGPGNVSCSTAAIATSGFSLNYVSFVLPGGGGATLDGSETAGWIAIGR